MQEAADAATAQLRTNERLILAAHTGFVEKVEEFIAAGGEVHCRDKEGTPLLHFPSSAGKLDVVKLLLSKGVDIDAEDKTGQTALHFASQKNAHEVVKLLVKSGAWIDVYDGHDETPLHLAIRGGHVETVKHLLMAGAKTEITNSRGLTALGEAISVKNLEIFQLLVNKGADVHRICKGFSLLHLAAGVGSLEILQQLLRQVNPETVICPGGVTPLHSAAAKAASPAIVRLLLEHGSDPRAPDDDGKIPLDWAKDGGNDNEDVLKLLSVAERKRRSQRHRSSVVTEIEPADGPEGEWNAFQRMSYEDKLRQVEVWARSKEAYLNELVFLDNDSRKAVALVGNFMRLMECRLAIERLKTDECFQEDAADSQVQKAIAECTENPQNIRKFASNAKIMGVLMKLKRLRDVLRRNGRMKVVYEGLLKSGDPTQSALPEDENMSVVELEKALKTAKDAVVKAVMGGAAAGRKTEEGGNWWGMDSSANGDASGDDLKLGSVSFKSIFYQFLRQLFLAILVVGLMILGMYLTDSLPSQNPRSAPGNEGVLRPAFVTDDHRVHARLNEPNFNPEL